MLSHLAEKNPNKHLILFFDINGTIIATDSANGTDKDIAILKLLAENHSAIWDKSIAKEMTFREYIDEHICPGDSKDPTIKKNRQEYYAKFIQFLMTKSHPLLDQIKSEFNIIKENLNQDAISSLLSLHSFKI